MQDIIQHIEIDQDEPVYSSTDFVLRKCPFIRVEMTRLNASGIIDDPTIKDWIDNQDVIQTLHISKRTLQTLRSTGKLPYTKLNGKIFYLRRDVEKLLADNYTRNGTRNSTGKGETR